MNHRFLAGLVLTLVLASCSTGPDAVPPKVTVACQQAAANYDDALKPLLARWRDATTAAAKAERSDLDRAISTMQIVKGDAEAMAPDTCVAPVHALLLRLMKKTIESYQALSAQKPDDEVQRLLNGAGYDYNLVQEQIYYLRLGKPITAPPEPVQVIDMVQRYADAGYTMEGRELPSGGMAWTGSVDAVHVRVESYADGVLKSVFVTTDDERPDRATGLARAIQIAVPEWDDPETWIKKTLNAPRGSAIGFTRTLVVMKPFLDTNTLNASFY